MLIACSRCHRQYDVGSREPGAKVRCFCGELSVVPRERARQVRMLHCSSCGGRLAEGRTTCEFCSAQVALGDRGLGDACPECFARLVRGASFCSTCGTKIAPQVLRALTSLECPRCSGGLALCDNGGTETFTECTSCGGLWLTEATFAELSSRSETRAARALMPGGGAADDLPPRPRQPVQYLRCPECTQLMHRKSYAKRSGIVIDWCRGHGYWFDTHELEHILAFIEAGGLERARDRELARQEASLRRERKKAERAARDLRRGERRGGSWDEGFGLLYLLAAAIDLFTD